jgi:hypothetical protein
MAVIDAIADGRMEPADGLPFIESESNKIIALRGAVNSGLLTSSEAKLMLPPPDNYPKEKAKENLNKIKDMMKGVAAYD